MSNRINTLQAPNAFGGPPPWECLSDVFDDSRRGQQLAMFAGTITANAAGCLAEPAVTIISDGKTSCWSSIVDDN